MKDSVPMLDSMRKRRRPHLDYPALAFALALLTLIVCSFVSLDLRWSKFLGTEAWVAMARFVGELLHPNFELAFLGKLVWATLETLAMSAVGTLLALVAGLALALPASDSHTHADTNAQSHHPAFWRVLARTVLNVLRSVPELVWASLLLITAGLGPFAGTLALGLHTTGVLGRLFAEAIANAPAGPAVALRVRGVGTLQVFAYAQLPQILPQLMSYTLYRWENNIRAAAILGVVGAGGLGQLLTFHLGLFQMPETSSVLLAMMVLVAAVDGLSYLLRRVLSR